MSSQSRRAETFPEPSTERLDPARPDSDVYDLGVINLNPQEDVQNSFIMPYNGFIQRVGITWPAGSNNSIGANLTVNGGLIPTSEGNYQRAMSVVNELDTFFPQNYPNPEYVTDDDRYVPFRPLKFIPARAEVEADIFNGSATAQLDLQVRVSVTNFDPRILAGGSVPQRPPGGR